jgi:hypothetical protein
MVASRVFRYLRGNLGFLLLFFLFISCNARFDEKAKKDFNLKSSETSEELDSMLFRYLSLVAKDSIFDDQFFTKNNLRFTEHPTAFVYDVVKKSKSIQPKIQQRICNKGCDTLFFSFTITNKDTNLFSLGLTKENNKLSFMSPLFLNSQRLFMQSFDNIEYYFSKEHVFNQNNASQMCRFDSLLSMHFRQERFNFKYFIFDNITKAYKNEYSLKSARFHRLTTDQSQSKTAYTDSWNSIIFTGNSSEKQKHELVHLYTSKWEAQYSNPNRWFSEGLATYFGGHMSYTFEEQLCLVKEYMKSVNTKRSNFSVTSIPLILSKNTNATYVFGGLICELSFEKYGIEGVKKLFTYPRSRKGLFDGINEVLGMDEDEFNLYVFDKLKNHRCN